MPQLSSAAVKESVVPGTDLLTYLGREAQKDVEFRQFFQNFVTIFLNKGEYSVQQLQTGLELLDPRNGERVIIPEKTWLSRAVQLFFGEVYKTIVSSESLPDTFVLLRGLRKAIDFRDLCYHPARPQLVDKLCGMEKTLSQRKDLEFVKECLDLITMFNK